MAKPIKRVVLFFAIVIIVTIIGTLANKYLSHTSEIYKLSFEVVEINNEYIEIMHNIIYLY